MKTVLAGLAALTIFLGFAGNASAQDDLLYVTMELPVKPGMTEGFMELMTGAALETREFDGCRYFAILVDQSDPHKVLFYQTWDSLADLDAYRQWRGETNFGEKMNPFLAGPPTLRYFSLAAD